MSSEPYSFEEQLRFGNEWEEKAKDSLERFFLGFSVDSIDYEENPDMQKAGIDHILSKEEPAIDVKCQSHEKVSERALPFETMSSMEDGTPGWFVDPNKDTDLIVWVYPNKARTNLYREGYLMPFGTGIRDWFDKHVEEFALADVPNEGYTTLVRWVDIDAIPPQYLIQFDPRLPTSEETPQSDITEWAD
jgi:hypothetical protein